MLGSCIWGLYHKPVTKAVQNCLRSMAVRQQKNRMDSERAGKQLNIYSTAVSWLKSTYKVRISIIALWALRRFSIKYCICYCGMCEIQHLILIKPSKCCIRDPGLLNNQRVSSFSWWWAFTRAALCLQCSLTSTLSSSCDIHSKTITSLCH